MSSSKPKRLDLQGVRGIAIISVILFHFLPSIFPNGYIGVDQFFVLSGFLMCMLLRKSSSISIFQLISNFYIRRLKRILPAYFIIILFSIFMVFTIFPLTAIDTNIESGKKALIFMSNRVGTDDENYFSALSMAIDVFTHTWSLSVEVQFYVLVPFLFLLSSEVLRRKFEIPYYALLQGSSFYEPVWNFLKISSLSYIYSVFFLSEIAAFNSVPARIWQFLIGMIAFLLSDSQSSTKTGNCNKIYQKLEQAELLTEDEISEAKSEDVNNQNSFSSSSLNFYILIVIIMGSFSQMAFPPQILRPLITVLTGILMISPSKISEKLLESRFLTYFGDISYSLYLIHWPIYAYWKLELSHGMIWNWQLLIAFVLSILLAIISYEFYEKSYLKQSDKRVFIICIILIALNIGVFYGEDIKGLVPPPKKLSDRLDGLNESEIVSFEKADELNEQWSKFDLKNLLPPTCEYESKGTAWGICRHKGINNQTMPGKFKIMIIGNSWAANHAYLVYQECGNKAHHLVQMTISGCEPLFNNGTQHGYCKNAVGIFEGKVAIEKPDYLFIFARFINIGDPMPSNVTKLDNDPIYEIMKTQIEKISKSVKHKIFLMQQVPRLNIPMLATIVDTVKAKKDLAKFDNSLITMDPKMARLRYEKLVSECPKCELFDYKPYFFNETTKTWRFYDEKNHGLTYITQGLHLSFHGLELIRPAITGVCKRVGMK